MILLIALCQGNRNELRLSGPIGWSKDIFFALLAFLNGIVNFQNILSAMTPLGCWHKLFQNEIVCKSSDISCFGPIKYTDSSLECS